MEMPGRMLVANGLAGRASLIGVKLRPQWVKAARSEVALRHTAAIKRSATVPVYWCRYACTNTRLFYMTYIV